MCLSMTKNVAAASWRRRTSSSCGVAAGFGPSSNVRYTVGGFVGGIRHTVRSVTSSRNGNGVKCDKTAAATMPTSQTIRAISYEARHLFKPADSYTEYDHDDTDEPRCRLRRG